MKINVLTFSVLFAASQAPLLLPAVAADGLSGATVSGRREPSPEQRQAAREQCQADPAKCRAKIQARQAERFKHADTDGNGALSRAEAEKGMPVLSRHFDRIDANKDGQITREETEAARKARDGARKSKAG